MKHVPLMLFVLLFSSLMSVNALAQDENCPDVSDLKAQIEALSEKQNQTYALLEEVREELRKIKMRSGN